MLPYNWCNLPMYEVFVALYEEVFWSMKCLWFDTQKFLNLLSVGGLIHTGFLSIKCLLCDSSEICDVWGVCGAMHMKFSDLWSVSDLIVKCLSSDTLEIMWCMRCLRFDWLTFVWSIKYVSCSWLSGLGIKWSDPCNVCWTVGWQG